jgi:N-methylhydantoinase B
MTYTTVEMSETQYPHLTEEHEYVTDLAGPGQWRGGNGVRTVQQMIDHEGTASAIVWGNRHPSRGLCGGHVAAPNRVIFRYGSPDEAEIPGGRALELRLRPGERICTVRGGGGGWGDPLARDPAAVREDVLDELVSLEAARRDYGVVLDPATLEVDAAATAALRAELAHAHEREQALSPI